MPVTWNPHASVTRGASGGIIVRTPRGAWVVEDADVEAIPEMIRAGKPPPDDWIDALCGIDLVVDGASPTRAKVHVDAPASAAAAVEAALASIDAFASGIDEAEIVLVLALDGRPSRIRNAQRAAGERTLIPIELDGPTLRYGPIRTPGEACWECAELRALNNAGSREQMRAARADADAPSAAPSFVVSLAAGIAAALVAAAIEGRAVASEQWSLDLATLALDRAPVLAVPGCPGCAAPTVASG